MRFPVQITDHEETTDKINKWRYLQIQPPLKVQSVKQYISNYNRIAEHMNAKDNDKVYFLERYEDVVSALKTIPSRVGVISQSTFRNYISGLYQIGLVCEIDTEILHNYSNLRDSMNQKQNEIIMNSEFTEAETLLLSQLNNVDKTLTTTQWMYNILDTMSETIFPIGPDPDMDKLSWFMTMRILLDHRFRNDLCGIYMGTEEQMNNSEWKNWLVKRENGWYIVLNDFKTKKEGDEEKNIKLSDGPEPGLNYYLDIWYNYKNKDIDIPPFINDKKNKTKMLDTKRFSEFLLKNNKKYLGAPIGTKLLRKMFYTEKYHGIISEITNDANQNLHSVGTALNHYAKNTHSKGHYTNQI